MLHVRYRLNMFGGKIDTRRIVIGSVSTDSYDGITPVEGGLDFLATFLHFAE